MSELSLEEIDSIIRDVLPKEIASNYKIIISRGSQKGDGFLSNLLKVSVRSKEESVLHFIIKYGFYSEALRKIIAVNEVFRREIYFYDTIYPNLIKFQEKKKITDKFKSIPKCYKTSVEDGKELLVMENLLESGFKQWDVNNLLDCVHVKFILREFAKFHATSFAVRDQDLSLFDEITANMQELFNVINKNFIFELLKNIEKVRNYYSVGSGIYEALKKHQENFVDFIKDLEEGRHLHLAISHGDCWSNNIMFKYDECGDLIEICIIDFQMARIASPVLDLSMLIYTSTSPEIYHNLNLYLEFYYDCFQKHLSSLGSDPEKCYSFDTFKSDWKKYSRFGATLATIAHKLTLKTDEEKTDIADVAGMEKSLDDVFVNEIRNEDVYRSRLIDIMNHMFENKCL